MRWKHRLYFALIVAIACLSSLAWLANSARDNPSNAQSNAASTHTIDVPVSVIQAGGTVDSLAWSPDGQTLAVQTKPTKGNRRGIQLWSMPTAKEQRSVYDGTTPVFSVSYSSEGTLLACGAWVENSGEGGAHSEVWLFNTDKLSLDKTLLMAPYEGLSAPFTSDVLCTAQSPDGQLVAASSKLTGAGALHGSHIGGEVCVWDAKSGELIWNNRTTHTDIVYSVVFSPDGKMLASGGIDKLIRLWDARTGELLKTLTGAAWDGVASLSFSSDGKLIASGGHYREEGDTVRVWNVETGLVLHRLTGFKRNGSIRIAFSPVGDTLFATGGQHKETDDNTNNRPEAPDANPTYEIREWNARTGELVGVYPSRPGYSRAIAVSPDGRYVAVGTFEENVAVYDTKSSAR